MNIENRLVAIEASIRLNIHSLSLDRNAYRTIRFSLLQDLNIGNRSRYISYHRPRGPKSGVPTIGLLREHPNTIIFSVLGEIDRSHVRR